MTDSPLCLHVPCVSLPRAQDYNNLCQCESLEDVKLNLQETDYDQFLSQENKVTPAALQDKATKKLVGAGSAVADVGAIFVVRPSR